MSNNAPGRYLTSGEVMDMFGISRATLTRWLGLGMPRIQAAGRKGRLTFDREEVLEWARDGGAASHSRWNRTPPGSEVAA